MGANLEYSRNVISGQMGVPTGLKGYVGKQESVLQRAN